jgi:GH35 family endo-1,4-beta-xylanase
MFWPALKKQADVAGMSQRRPDHGEDDMSALARLMIAAAWSAGAAGLGPAAASAAEAAGGATTAPRTETAKALAPENIAERIARYRTAEVTLTLTGADGKPLAGKAVSVRMVRHRFLFGCNAFKLDASDESKAQRDYRSRFAGLLNFATLPFYWGRYEPRPGQTNASRVEAMARWCRDNGIRTKGHPLCWHQVCPRWAMDMDPNEVRKLQIARITREVKGFAGLIDTWDVVNEAVVMPNFNRDANPISKLCRKLGQAELIKETFAAARAANASATLLLNDYDTSPKYERLIEECLKAGAAIDVIGIQSHMHGGYRGAAWAWETCERFARFNKPLNFTELTITSGLERKDIRWQGPSHTDWPTTPEGEARQARQVEEFYTVLFSHPAVQAITWWDFSDDRAWLGAPAGLVRKDMTPKPAYEALLKLVKDKWWTAPQTLTTDAAGRVRFTGYLGDYEATCGQAKAAFSLDKPGTAAVTLRPQ